MTTDRYLAPWVIQLLGVILIVAAAIFWGVTGRESTLLMGSAMTLIGIGAYRAGADKRKVDVDRAERHHLAPGEEE